MKIITTKNHGRKTIWYADDYKQHVKELRADKRFFGFDAESGYNLSKPLSASKKKAIKKAIAARDYLDLRESVDMVYYHTPKSTLERKTLMQSVGEETGAISFKHLRSIPITKPPKVPDSDIVVTFDKKTKALNMSYKSSKLEVIQVPIDFHSVYRNLRDSGALEFEENELLDSFIVEISRDIIAKLQPFEDGHAAFRLATYAGDLDAARYGVWRSVEGVMVQLDMLLQQYGDMKRLKNGDVTGGVRVNAISVHRRKDREALTKSQESRVTADYREIKKAAEKRAAARNKKRK